MIYVCSTPQVCVMINRVDWNWKYEILVFDILTIHVCDAVVSNNYTMSYWLLSPFDDIIKNNIFLVDISCHILGQINR